MTEGPSPRDRRLLVLAPTAKDAAILQSVLEPIGVDSDLVSNCVALADEIEQGAAVALIAEEALTADGGERLIRLLSAQPPWSDFPILVLAHQGADSAELAEAVRTFGNVTLLERPIRIATLVSAVQTAMRARERQYQIRG